MNLYSYWFFFLYNIYYKFSRDQHFYVFAFGMFNAVFLGFPMMSIFTLLGRMLKGWGVYSPFHDSYIWFLIPTIYTCVNYFLFMHEGKHRRLHSKYISIQSTSKDVLCFFLSLMALSSFFLVIFFS